MRRVVFVLMISGYFILTLACGAGLLYLRSYPVSEVILPGATGVRIDQRRALNWNISYRLPPDRTQSDVRRRLVEQGWQREQGPAIDSLDFTTQLFARQSWSGMLIEVVVIQRRATDRRVMEIEIGSCIRLGQWAVCP
jgi:hypothetical protein